MLKFFFLNSIKGDKNAIAKKAGAAGRTDGCAGAENMAAKGLGSKAGTSAKFRSPVGGRTAGLKETGANRSWVSEEHRRADRGFKGNRRAQVTAKS